MTSARFTPAATTSRTTSPGPATGSGTSATCSIPGPPGEDTTTARPPATLPLPPPPARRTEVHDRGRTREPSAAIMHFGPGSRGRGGPRCMIAAAPRRGEEVLGEGEVGGGVEVERGAGADRHAGQAQGRPPVAQPPSGPGRGQRGPGGVVLRRDDDDGPEPDAGAGGQPRHGVLEHRPARQRHGRLVTPAPPA